MVKRRRLYLLLPLVILIVIMAINAIPVYANPQQTVAVTENNLEWATFIYSSLIIAGLIISTLSYVSWRKYKGKLKREQNNDKMVD
ncbi:sporulation protein YpjB [Oceanobacillus chungangensis]|uniref:Uncharacterized protein n=1 Tax=Oceanobacillus chungangensis TaxID=1229152 RepID=A0A3D8Q334_9BACI|nr:sporulation protein YpjB [Oceanobacillus chungangensis]RDW22059.1 hypothetical protein CWR45_00790 [Oceanobacillus chungangensis]